MNWRYQWRKSLWQQTQVHSVSLVSFPFVRLYYGTIEADTLNDGEQCGRVAPFHNLYVSTGWRIAGVNYSKDPDLVLSLTEDDEQVDQCGDADLCEVSNVRLRILG